MKMVVEKYIENRLKLAQYKFDKGIKAWIGWIESVPGVFAQADTLEEVRGELAEILEEHLLLSLHDGQNPKTLGSEFKNFYAKASISA